MCLPSDADSLFDVYDDVVNAPDALTLVQNHLS